MDNVKICLIGLGTVGTGVIKIFEENRDILSRRSGQKIEFVKVACRDIKKKRTVSIDSSLFTQEWREVVDHPDIDIVVELIGGIHPAKEQREHLLLRASRKQAGRRQGAAESPQIFPKLKGSRRLRKSSWHGIQHQRQLD